ncbi:hypothetical protein IO424_001766 [Campylobacter fetus]|uniref:hypothetical protein n=1 Tax=Campylobacter fetus TaxID=196 RepID=UPI000508EE86|nr:hypothetical protein [Campylobacter fetus]WKW17954.1 hypothetical protein IXZ25_03500 [Campylobacter fetus subsp. fetus]AIR78583.1 hypothetical protein CFF04554_0666 [Campylobacter fetus subsp. fetus 04/554]EGK8073893.1 hypothetical protein [Campylobacter fetus]EGK8172966.1 hypothetical protein [Campylobacter fetus]HDX6332410.1 hypothetical protein [Campylobacter fetus]
MALSKSDCVEFVNQEIALLSKIESSIRKQSELFESKIESQNEVLKAIYKLLNGSDYES